MGYYENKKQELEELLLLVKSEKEKLRVSVLSERKQLDEELEKCEKIENGVRQLTKERQIGFPWLAKAYEELFVLRDFELVSFLKNKKRPALRASEIVKEQTKLRREAESKRKIAEYLVEYYESIAPFLIDLKEEVEDISSEDNQIINSEYTEQEKSDAVSDYLKKEEYRKLSTQEKNQLALDRFWKRKKSKWLIGRLYERYVGYIYEEKGYEVDYVGIYKGFEDLGRDLICEKDNEMIVIQCKNWSQFRTIYEKHIFQFFGTVFQYKDENPDKKTKAIFYTSTNLSDLASRFAKELNIGLVENFKLNKDYASIKCNVSRSSGEKIYHLPFDQQYDKTKIEKNRNEFYCKTVKKAEEAGFRRAFRYSKLKQENR